MRYRVTQDVPGERPRLEVTPAPPAPAIDYDAGVIIGVTEYADGFLRVRTRGPEGDVREWWPRPADWIGSPAQPGPWRRPRRPTPTQHRPA